MNGGVATDQAFWYVADYSYGAGAAYVTSANSATYGLRPIFMIKSDIHYIEENGTKVLVK